MPIQFRINQLADLDPALAVAKEVFKPSSQDLKKYHDRDDWLHKIDDGGLLVVAVDGQKIVGFVICYKADEQTLHIWNVGVLPAYRGQKIWSQMYERIKNYAREQGFTMLTLNTYGKFFSTMLAFAQGHGFQLIKQADVERNGIMVEKSFFKLNL